MTTARPLRIGLLALAALLAAVGVAYLTIQCQHLPSPLPGREAGSTDHRVGYAAVSFVLAVLALAAATFGGRLRMRPT